jgi:hypothetical protein
MSYKRKVADTITDPTLPKTPLELNGTTYNLCFDLGALAEAESHYVAAGHEDICLISQLPNCRLLQNLLLVFPCTLRKFHPEITWEQAQALVTLKTMLAIGGTVALAWEAASVPASDVENPPVPVETS